NPAGGCLPLVLQMPFLYALYSVLNLNIDLRQQGFLPVWLTDLSVPDVILSLPFKLPLFNIDQFSGLALLMGATLFVQQKQAITDPRQKAMVYLMPVMLTLMFSSLPSGLNLYYFVFNVVAIGQTIWQKKFSKNQLTLADLKKMPKKESWLQRKMREAQEMAQAQGKSIPGQQFNKSTGKSSRGDQERRPKGKR
ncbi:MAG: membrane protein insertase YidC, partial [Bacteroidota bacterium]